MAEDPHVVLEKLHNQWSAATDELDGIWRKWRGDRTKTNLRDSYFATQERVLKLVQQIMAHKAKHHL